jgi:hypothetical protein
MEIYGILNKIQTELKAPKNQRNNFGNYNYRSCEDILEAVKPLLQGAVLVLNDEIVNIGTRFYVKATATISVEGGASISNAAFAREEETKKGMDAAQITGSASSYARKYALNGLFMIDDTKDADATNQHGKETPAPTKGQNTTRDDDVPDFAPDVNPPKSKAADAITEAQGKRLFAISHASGIPAKEAKRFLMHFYNVEHSKDIPKAKYEEICKSLENKEKFDALMATVPA